jgi:hypothetical protein
MLVMSRIRHAAIVSLNRVRSRAKKSSQNIPKNRCRTTIADRMVETLAELPFIGDQIGLFKAQPSRPQRTATPLDARLTIK